MVRIRWSTSAAAADPAAGSAVWNTNTHVPLIHGRVFAETSLSEACSADWSSSGLGRCSGITPEPGSAVTSKLSAAYKGWMKPLALLLFALVGIAAAGCGSGTKVGSDPSRVTGTTTTAGVASDTLISASASRGSTSGRVSDLQFTYPRGYHARPFKSCSLAVTGDRNGGCERGVVIASYPLRSQPEIAGSGARFSSKGVALELYRPPADNGLADVRLGNRRLSLWQFDAADDSLQLPGEKAAPPEQWGAWFRVNGASYSAIAWVGNNARKVDRAKLAAVINSVHRRGQTPRAPSPKPAPQVTRVLCGGTASNPRVPDNALVGAASDLICVQIVGHTCHVWTRPVGAPPADVRERHLQLRANFCRFTRDFLRRHPRGSSVQPARPGLTALLPRVRT